MKPMLSKLHTYVSLASPHVGSLFPSSQIVSTGKAWSGGITPDDHLYYLTWFLYLLGMWALFKWKKYKALKVTFYISSLQLLM